MQAVSHKENCSTTYYDGIWWRYFVKSLRDSYSDTDEEIAEELFKAKDYQATTTEAMSEESFMTHQAEDQLLQAGRKR
jgi:hypothetical protein